MNNHSFEIKIKRYPFKNDFFEWISMTKFNLKFLENKKKLMCLKYFEDNKFKIIEYKKKIKKINSKYS
jgi:hypothetical protein